MKALGFFYIIHPTGALILLPRYRFRDIRLPRLISAESGKARPDRSPLSEAIRLFAGILAHFWDAVVQIRSHDSNNTRILNGVNRGHACIWYPSNFLRPCQGKT